MKIGRLGLIYRCFWSSFLNISARCCGPTPGRGLALLAFFAFPIIQYGILKFSTRREGSPGLWYLPAYGFRLVIRNLPSKKRLFDIKYRSFLRDVVPSREGSSVSTFIDTELIKMEDFFLFPGTDQVLISFRLERDAQKNITFVHTDKLGNALSKKPFNEFKTLISDYMATIDNLFHFDVKISKRVKISKEDLEKMLLSTEKDNREQPFPVTETLDVG